MAGKTPLSTTRRQSRYREAAVSYEEVEEWAEAGRCWATLEQRLEACALLRPVWF